MGNYAYLFITVIFYLTDVPGTEPMTSYMLGMHSITELYPSRPIKFYSKNVLSVDGTSLISHNQTFREKKKTLYGLKGTLKLITNFFKLPKC